VLFHSPEFILFFLPLTLAGYLALDRYAAARAAIAFLALASLFFYGWWNPLYLPLLSGSIGFNYAIGRLIMPDAKRRGRDTLLVAGVAANLAALALFKYADFAIRTIDWATELHIPPLGLALPLAISFFTFQQIAFLVDSYQGNAPERSFPAYCLFITFFPHLIAGPIVHHKEMMPQFARLYGGNRRSTEQIWGDLAVGLAIFAIGLVKKVFFADKVAIWADNAFAAADSGIALSFIESWLGVLCFTLQIYLDFSGYSDMAIGLARLFGVKLPLNFNSPYKAASIIDFWRRWHMTLSRFLRDYLYVPLGGNRAGGRRRYVNVMLVMLLGGLWHGASWTFVAWGGLHGIFLVVNHAWRAWRGAAAPAWGAWPGRLLTLFCVMVAWVFFRAGTFDSAWLMLRGLFGFNGLALPMHWQPSFAPVAEQLARIGIAIQFNPMPVYGGGMQVAWAVGLLLVMWLLPNTQEIMRQYDPALGSVAVPGGPARRFVWQPSAVSGMACAALALAALFAVMQGKPGEFIYFQF
jgi:alginate O-acetyltransferase complex protein AlgI